MEISVMEKILDKNERLAAELREKMTKSRVFCVNILGSPGAGKTTLLSKLIPMLSKKSFVIEGDIQSDIDAQTLEEAGIPAVQINTGGACHLEASQIEAALADMPQDTGFVFVENIGNLVCPAEFLIGEHVKILIATVTEGSDKPYKYPLAFEKADLIILNKVDLVPYVAFDREFFTKGLRKLNEKVEILEVSGINAVGVEEVAHWLEKARL
ncbi:hydrogenase accessory protein HypB [Clostridia bacterium]|nr:hydrogenase accessory protein HypB [Clostridia bacterium]